MRHAVGIKNDAEFAGKTTKRAPPQVIKVAKMAKNDKNNTKRNHRAHKMADFMENCRRNEHQKKQTKPPRSRNGRFYGKLSEKLASENTNETTALKKWPIL